MKTASPFFALLAAALLLAPLACSRRNGVPLSDISSQVMAVLDDTTRVLTKQDVRNVGIFLDSLGAMVQDGDRESMMVGKGSGGEVFVALLDKYSRNQLDSVSFELLASKADAVLNAWKAAWTDESGEEFCLWNHMPMIRTGGDEDDGEMYSFDLLLFFDGADGACNDIRIFLPEFYVSDDEVTVNLAFANETDGSFFLGGGAPVLADSSYAVCDFLPELGGWVGSDTPFDEDKFFASDRLFIMSEGDDGVMESCTLDLDFLRDRYSAWTGKEFEGFFPSKTRSLDSEHEALAAEAEALGGLAGQDPASEKAWKEFSGFLSDGRTADAARYYKANQDAVLGHFRLGHSRSRFTIELLYPVLHPNFGSDELRDIYIHALESCRDLAESEGVPADSAVSSLYSEILKDIEHFKNDE